MRLTSETTTLRRLRPSDLRAFQSYRNDPVVARFQSWEVMDDARATGFLSAVSNMEPLLQPGQWSQIAVADSGTDALIGDVGLHLSQDATEAEMGITLASEAQGQGHATRACKLAMGLLFDTTSIHQITAGADIRNTASLALMHRLGFSETGQTSVDDVLEVDFKFLRP